MNTLTLIPRKLRGVIVAKCGTCGVPVNLTPLHVKEADGKHRCDACLAAAIAARQEQA